MKKAKRKKNKDKDVLKVTEKDKEYIKQLLNQNPLERFESEAQLLYGYFSDFEED